MHSLSSSTWKSSAVQMRLWDLWCVLVACESSCGHMFCNQSRWELMVPKWDQHKSSPAFILFSFLSVPLALCLTCFVTLSSCLLAAHILSTSGIKRQQKCSQPFLTFCVTAHGLVPAASLGGHSSHFHPRLHRSTGRQEVEARSGAAPVQSFKNQYA